MATSDIRNHPANLQIITKRLPSLSKSECEEDLSLADLTLATIEPQRDPDAIASLRKSCRERMETGTKDPKRQEILAIVSQAAQSLTLAHYMDESWTNPENHPLHRKLKP